MQYIIPVAILLIAVWFLVLRPQQRQATQRRQMEQALTQGAEVMLTSGIYGTVADKTDDYVLVTVADGVTLKVAPGAVGRVVPKPEPDAPDGDVAAPEES